MNPHDPLATQAGTAPAIGAPGRASLSYEGLRTLVGETGEALRGYGIGTGDRVAIVLPNGPVLASAFLAVANCAAAAPLNPAYRDAEFDFYLSDLGARALVTLGGWETAARKTAARLGLAVIELRDDAAAPAGAFDLEFPGTAAGAAGGRGDRDTALVLHTSGTTSRPKMVPLSRANMAASARHIGDVLRLSDADRCLNVMPLFHIHGLIAAVLASLHAGGEVVCTPGFNATKFFGWLDAGAPSWYTAVPAMHQAILERAPRNEAIVGRARLRLIRSSSAALPAPVMARLGQVFRCPVIESYGMTEAAHQIASNLLPPGARKAGSVGVGAGPEVALMDTDGRFVGPGGEGEIVIRGPNVTAGYERDPRANVAAFTRDPGGGADWFRTGDLGVLDADGYLRINGRLKEIINRGGEKIAPREVDDILLSHPAVAEAVTFAVSHPKLGEEVAAAIVLRAGATASPSEIREFAAARLARFKVPRRLLILDDIPKGSTGKVQRIGLARTLGLED